MVVWSTTIKESGGRKMPSHQTYNDLQQQPSIEWWPAAWSMPLPHPVCLLLTQATTENAVGFVQDDPALYPHTGSFFFCSVHNFRMLPKFDVALGRAAFSLCTSNPRVQLPLRFETRFGPLFVRFLPQASQSSTSRASIFGSRSRRFTKASKVSFMSWTCLPSCADAGLQLRSSAKARTLCSIGLKPMSFGSHHRTAVSSSKRCAIRVRTVNGKT